MIELMLVATLGIKAFSTSQQLSMSATPLAKSFATTTELSTRILSWSVRQMVHGPHPQYQMIVNVNYQIYLFLQ